MKEPYKDHSSQVWSKSRQLLKQLLTMDIQWSQKSLPFCIQSVLRLSVTYSKGRNSFPKILLTETTTFKMAEISPVLLILSVNWPPSVALIFVSESKNLTVT